MPQTRIRRSVLSLLVCSLLLITTPNLRADNVSYEFSGTVTSTTGVGGVSVGSTFSGSFAFDPLTGVPASLTVTAAGNTFTMVGTTGYADLTTSGGTTSFGFSIKPWDPLATSFGNLAPQEALLLLDSTQPGGITGTLANLLVDPAKLDMTYFSLVGGYVEPFGPDQVPTLNGGQFWAVNGEVTSVTRVGGSPPLRTPEPGTLLLAVVGVAGWGCGRRRRG